MALQKYKAYRVYVKTTNTALRDTFRTPDNEYYDCEDGQIIVITRFPELIFDELGADTVKKIEEIGIGYLLDYD